MHKLRTLFGTAALLAGLAMAPAVQGQVSINIGVQPVCSYGYYGYAPYACAPMGYYGPGYFYNGIFLGMGPWGGWGYSHGWGSHRFVSEGGGSYHGGPGPASYRATSAQGRGGGQVRGNAAIAHGGSRPSAGHATVARTSASRPSRAVASHATASHTTATHASAPHASTAHSSGGGGHAGGDKHK
jgi:hypothetical protein